MDVMIQAVSFTADRSLKDFVTEKVQKLSIFFDGIVSCEVYLKVDRKAAANNKVSEIKINIPGKELFAKKQCDSFEEATDLVTDALRRQLMKYKEKTLA